MITKSLTVLLKKILAVLGAVLIAILLSVDKSVKCSTKYHEVVFISSSVMRTEEIVDDLPQHTDIVYLVDDRKGLWEITDYLSYQNDIDAIRIISHGNAGYLALNGELIDAEYIARRHEWVESWGGALSEDADIMLYGCNVAATAEGRALVRLISGLTGADVAASTDMTGGTGNWDLEYQDGPIEAAGIDVDGYKHHLATYTVTSNADAGAGTLRQAIIDANVSGVDDTINIQDSIATITVLSQLPTIVAAGGGLTIDGGDGVTVQVTTPYNWDGTSGSATATVSRVFNINASGEAVTISNMTIKGGDISGLSSPNYYGGGIYHAAGTLELNTVTVSGSKGNEGGGVYSTIGTISISDSSVIQYCYSVSNGGNIRVKDGTLTITNSTITNGTGTGGGGGISSQSSTLTISGTTISDNATSPNSGKHGGGINSNGGSISIDSSSIIRDNSAGEKGGGLFITGSTSTEITDSTISGNTASKVGGIYNNGAATITGSTISGNTASASGGKGGGIYNRGDTLNLTGSTISGNIVTNGTNGGGGGIYSDTDGALVINTSTISDNSVNTAGDGGGIFARDTSTISNSTISGNTAAASGGGIIFSYFYSFVGSTTGYLTFQNSTISGNTAGTNGGGIYSKGASMFGFTGTAVLISNNSTISGNTATTNGGGVYIAEYSNFEVKNTILADNNTEDDYYFNGGTLTDNGYNVVEYQSGVSTGPNKTFTATTDILYNTKADGTTGYSTWNQNNSNLANQNLNLAASLADNGGPTLTLALESGSFAEANADTGIPPASNWNGSPLIDEEYTDQRGVVRTAGQNTSIGAYSANYDVPPTVLATTTPTSYDCSVTKVEMHNGTSWVTIFTGTTALDIVPGGTFPEISDVSLPAGTYSQIRVTFTNAFPLKGSRSYGGNTYYTTATTFGGQTNLASTPTTDSGSEAEFTFRIEDWGAINAEVPQTFAITPITVDYSTDYQPTVRVTISDKLELKGTDGTPSTYYFALSAPTVSIVEP